MKKSILKSSIALAVAGVFGATVAVTAAEQATPVPVTQEVAATAAPVAEPATHQVVPTIQVTPAAKTEAAPTVAKVEVTPAAKVVPTAAKVEVTPATPTAKDITPVPTATQDVKAPVAQDTVVPAAANPAAATPTIETAAVAKAPSEAKVVRAADKKVEANKDEKNTKKAQAHKAPKVKADKADKAVKETKEVKADKKADKKETTKEEKKNSKSGKSQPSTTSKQAGVVDQNSIFVIGANYLIDQFENKYGDSKITKVSFKAADKTAIYEVDGFNASGAHSMTLDVATGNVTEGTPKAYDASMEASAIDAGTVLPPHVAINAAFAQTGNVATGINSWSVVNQNGKPIYTVEFHDAQNKPVSIALDAKTGMAVK